MAGRRDEAFAIMQRIGGRASAEFAMREISASLTTQRRAWRDLLQPGIRRAVMVGFLARDTDPFFGHQHRHRLRPTDLPVRRLEP